ncbi:MAG TPA: nucleotidyltransferase domain-containing protein [Candidatus Dormibacteraeota bacterium]|nr:nucleotidyltransferase domain-containing protein [Candidatus Dormibacteraeota bacterium]
MFTVEDRRSVREGLLAKARTDKRVVAGAEVGSTAVGGGDRWSDLDLTFGIADGTNIDELLGDWTAWFADKFGAMHLFDLPFLSSIYRVFLVPGNLQVDLSFTPRADFGATSPKFTLLFGTAVTRKFLEPSTAANIFGLGVHHAVRARICIERERVWQAEYWISGVRDQALALACRLRGLESGNGRGFDDLPPEVLDPFKEALVRSLEREELMRALTRAVDALLAAAAGMASRIDRQLRALTSED